MLLSIGFLLIRSTFAAQTPPSPGEVALQAGSFGIVVPSYIPVFNPTGILSVTYSTTTGPVSIGGAQQLSPIRVGSTPAIAFNPLAGSTQSSLYMLAMVDMDLPAIYLPGVLHWAQSDLTLNSDTGALTSIVKPVAEYTGPAPPEGTGTHRYVFLLYAQPAGFKLDPKYQNMPTKLALNTARLNFNFADFLATSGFGDPIGGNFFKSTYDGSVGVNTVVVTATGVPSGNTAGQTAAPSMAAAATSGVSRMAPSVASTASGVVSGTAVTATSSTAPAAAATASKASSAISRSFKVSTFGLGFVLAIAELYLI